MNYWNRIFTAYLKPNNQSSQLTFWHEKPAVNEQAAIDQLGQYYMTFVDKTRYPGPFDAKGVPLLDYRGIIGKQYNPIAISQYGLGYFNLYKKTGNKNNLTIATTQAEWLINNLEANEKYVKVWMHHFDWEYRDKLKSPWYSALAQGNGISLLTRIYQETNNVKYLTAAQEAFQALLLPIEQGGALFVDEIGNFWLEETIVNPPTHILNGFLWTVMGVWDLWLTTKDEKIKIFFEKCLKTLGENLPKFDAGFWSLYEQSGTTMTMLASPFYHRLHIVQLKILYAITRQLIFQEYANRWEGYSNNKLFQKMALIYKSIFKILYY